MWYNIINTKVNIHDINFINFSLDTIEGSNCVGHWIWECGLFLPLIKDLQINSTIPIKILLHNSKRYKINILKDFGFGESDIIYSSNITNNGKTWQENYVMPMETSYIMYVPKFFYLWHEYSNIRNDYFLNTIELFRNFYIPTGYKEKKTIPILYLIRSKKENYTNKTFLNIDKFSQMLEKNNVDILNIDNLNSLKPQFNIILKSKVIIMEMGSVFAINASLIATNSHIIILNDHYDYYNSNLCFIELYRYLMKKRNNTVEIYDTCRDINNIDINRFENFIQPHLINIPKKQIRNQCVVCNNLTFELVSSFPKFGIMAIANDLVLDQYYDLNLISCNKCNCLQLKNLVDASILYSDVYTNATFSPSWENHDIFLSDFILENSEECTFIEVGANKGGLYNILKRKREINFNVLDMYKDDKLDKNINFIEGNCETFDFTGYKNIILSHVFEHLYSPLVFIENIRNANVCNVFISIPNFENLLEEKSTSIIYSQHTFYCGKDYIIYMFSLFNYKCEKYYAYDGNCKSNMFKFVLDNNVKIENIPNTNVSLYKNIYIDKILYYQNIEVPVNSYIIPSGIYGQFLYYFLKNKENIIGFIDNEPQRHNNKLYATNKYVNSPLNIDYKNSTIIVCDCPYKTEIINGLEKINSNINFLLI